MNKSPHRQSLLSVFEISSEYWPAQPNDPSTIRVASVIAFFVCLFSVCLFSVTFFLILLQYNIWVPHPELQCMWSRVCTESKFKKTWYFYVNCNVSDADFSFRVKLRRYIRSGPQKPAPATFFKSYCSIIYDHHTQTAMYVIPSLHWELN